MDTTKKYILMCEKVPDEMKQKFHGQTDWYVYIISMGLEGVFIFGDIALRIKKFDVIFPVFRQDRLQEMIELDPDKITHTFPIDLIIEMFFFCFEGGDFRYSQAEKYTRQFSSMEQLWLAFVMKEKYNKIWNGKEWTPVDNK